MVRVGVASSTSPEARAYHIDALADVLATSGETLDDAIGRRHTLLQACASSACWKAVALYYKIIINHRLREAQHKLAAQEGLSNDSGRAPDVPLQQKKQKGSSLPKHDQPSRAALRAKIQQLKQQLHEVKSAQRAQMQARRLGVLRWAEVVVGTLVAVGSTLCEAQQGRRPGQEPLPIFDAVVADEAAQVVVVVIVFTCLSEQTCSKSAHALSATHNVRRMIYDSFPRRSYHGRHLNPPVSSRFNLQPPPLHLCSWATPSSSPQPSSAVPHCKEASTRACLSVCRPHCR